MNSSAPLLQVNVGSFSYKKGVPSDLSEHGGGFVFDCRCLLNPGRELELKDKTGQHHQVAKFLDERDDAIEFWQHVQALVLQAVKKYQERGFTYLSIQFGCTGGQHRSVYFAEKVAALLSHQPELSITVTHRDMPR